MFDAVKERDYIIEWIKKWFEENGPEANAVIGISGGKDSTIVAALLVEALGKNRVFGVLMPQDIQSDIRDAEKVVKTLGIANTVINIGSVVRTLSNSVINGISADNYQDGELRNGWSSKKAIPFLSDDTIINIPARIRMTTLYAVAQSIPGGGRVANTCNRSEDYIGYSTKYGDAAGDFAPIANYLVSEVKQIGHSIELLKDIPELIDKTPSDGLCGKTDEDRFGFTYDTLDKYIITGQCENENVREKIDKMHRANLHKLKTIPVCE